MHIHIEVMHMGYNLKNSSMYCTDCCSCSFHEMHLESHLAVSSQTFCFENKLSNVSSKISGTDLRTSS